VLLDDDNSEPQPVDFSLFWSDVNANTIKSHQRAHLDSGFFEQTSLSERFDVNSSGDKFSTFDDIVSQIVDDEGTNPGYQVQPIFLQADQPSRL
jgi:hypothetical protein